MGVMKIDRMKKKPKELPILVDDLVNAIQQGEFLEHCWQALYELYGHQVALFAMRLAGQNSDIADIVQNTFTKAIERIDSLKDTKSFKAWLMKIAYNCTIDLLRKQKRELAVEEDVIEPVAAVGRDINHIVWKRNLVERVKETLTGKERLVWILRFEQWMSYEEISQATSIPLNTVRSHLRRAKKHIQNNPAIQKLISFLISAYMIGGGVLL